MSEWMKDGIHGRGNEGMKKMIGDSVYVLLLEI